MAFRAWRNAPGLRKVELTLTVPAPERALRGHFARMIGCRGVGPLGESVEHAAGTFGDALCQIQKPGLDRRRASRLPGTVAGLTEIRGGLFQVAAQIRLDLPAFLLGEIAGFYQLLPGALHGVFQ